ncbi:NIPSNAP family protein, partial [Ancylostoma duodenale]
PGSMIEWANAWAKGITFRRDANQDVGGFFAQVGQLYIVYHIWAYPSMCARNETRHATWAKPGWDATVAYTEYPSPWSLMVVALFSDVNVH